MTRPAPPAAWAIAAILISPLLYTSAELAVVAAHGLSWSADDEVSRRIDDYFTLAAPPDTQRGVMLGISGGLCAFAGAPADGAVRVLPIAAIGQGFHELYPYLDQVIAHRPDFILIQGTALRHRQGASHRLPGRTTPAPAAAAGAAAGRGWSHSRGGGGGRRT